MARVLCETSLSLPIARQRPGVRIEIRVVCKPHIHDPIVLADTTAIEASALQSIRDLPDHGPLFPGMDLEPFEEVSHQPIGLGALVVEVVLAGDALLELV